MCYDITIILFVKSSYIVFQAPKYYILNKEAIFSSTKERRGQI